MWTTSSSALTIRTRRVSPSRAATSTTCRPACRRRTSGRSWARTSPVSPESPSRSDVSAPARLGPARQGPAGVPRRGAVDSADLLRPCWDKSSGDMRNPSGTGETARGAPPREPRDIRETGSRVARHGRPAGLCPRHPRALPGNTVSRGPAGDQQTERSSARR
ncbi:exported hypothetical protein [Parafrankia sp. Ea1.12]|nr:exported hypothetical protein [Parafrankia sp. Ea1.12]